MIQDDNDHFIREHLARLCDDEETARLLDLCVGRLLKREGKAWRTVAERHLDEIRHIADWLAGAVVRNEPWLDNIDAAGRPKKIMKFGSLEAASREADKAMLKWLNNVHVAPTMEGDEIPYADLSDGYKVVRLLTPAALDRESSMMQHCVGGGSYDRRVEAENLHILSLRDRFGKAHVTMSVDVASGEIIEMKGKQNVIPAGKYLPYVREFLSSTLLGFTGEFGLFGMIRDAEGTFHKPEELPDQFVSLGGLNLLRARNIRWPKKMTVRGDFGAPGETDSLPDWLEVDGNLTLGTPIEKLPRHLKVGGDFHLDENIFKGEKLPESMDIRFLRLSLESRNILPRNFSNTGDLILFDIKSNMVPKRMQVGGKLTLKPEGFTKWKGDVECLDLRVINTRRLEFAAKLNVVRNLEATRNEVGLPEDLVISGNLVLYDETLCGKSIRLPQRMRVGGYMDLGRCRIETMSTDLRVGGDLILDDAVVDSLEGVKSIGGGLGIDRTSIKELPKTIRKLKYLGASLSSLERLPDGLRIKENLILIGTPMRELPTGLVVGGKLFVHDSGIKDLPDDAKIRGDIIGIPTPSRLCKAPLRGGSLPRPL